MTHAPQLSSEATLSGKAKTPVRSIALLSIAAFAASATMRVADPLIPQVAAEFSASAGEAAAIVTGFAVAYAVFMLLYGPLGDRFGKYRIVTIVTLLSAITSTATAFSPSLRAMTWLRAGSGMTAAAIMPLSMAYIAEVTDYEDRQLVLARFLTGQILGVISGQVFGGVFGDTLGWRGIFLALGAVYFSIGVLLVLELRLGRGDVPRSTMRWAEFVRLYFALFRMPHARWLLMAVCAEGFIFFGAFAFFAAFLRMEYGLSYIRIGLMVGTFGLGGLLYAVIVRRVVALLGERGLVLVGGILMASGFAIFAFMPLAVMPVVIGLIGIGFYMHHNTLQTQATQMAPAARGFAVSVFGSCFFVGQASGVAISGAGVDMFGFPPIFVAAALLLLALALVYRAALPRIVPALSR